MYGLTYSFCCSDALCFNCLSFAAHAGQGQVVQTHLFQAMYRHNFEAKRPPPLQHVILLRRSLALFKKSKLYG